MTFPELKTKRTQLVELSLIYLENLYEIFSDDRVTEYMDIESMTSLEQTEQEWINWPKNVYDAKTGIRWGILYNNRIIGTCGFHNIKHINSIKIAEIGYDLMVDYWRKGIVSEVAPTIIDYAFSVLNIDEIHAQVFPGNERSCKLLKKLGFAFERTIKLNIACKNKYNEEDLFVLKNMNNSGADN